MKYLLILTALFVFSSSEAKKKYYKWTDAEGNIHYTEKKPDNVSTSVVKVTSSNATKPPPKSNKPVATETAESQELSPEQQAVEEYNKALKAKTKAIQDRANCKAARSNLVTLQNTVRVSKIDQDTGHRVRLDNSARMQMLEVAKQSIRDLCK